MPDHLSELPLVKYRMYLIVQVMAKGADWFTAFEAVASTAIEHPEWDLEEKRTWAEWEKRYEKEQPLREA